MDDMQAIEQRVTRELLRRAGPSEPVDDAAIFAAAIATESPKWRFPSMFSSTKFVVAGAIVALFGGLLLTGVLTQPSDDRVPAVGASASATIQAEPTGAATSAPGPTTAAEADTSSTPDLLPGVDLVAEEVEPGVYRVTSDGHRDLAWVGDPSSYAVSFGAIVAGRDGSVWNVTLPVAPEDDCRATEPEKLGYEGTFGCLTFYRVGAPETHRLTDGSVLSAGRIVAGLEGVEVAEDGTIWATTHSGLQSFDGTSWQVHEVPENFAWGVELGPEGSVWAIWPDGRDRQRLGRLTDSGWRTSDPGPVHRNTPRLVASAEGEVFIVEHDGDIKRVDDIGRTPTVAKATGLDLGNALPRQGGDALWWIIHPDQDGPKQLVRYSVSGYQTYDLPHFRQGTGRLVGVAPDGAAWLAAGLLALRCDGIVRFDTSEARHFLGGTCPVSADIAADGSVWVQAIPTDERDRQASIVDTYVITPEAIAAVE